MTVHPRNAGLTPFKRWSFFLVGCALIGWSLNAFFLGNSLITGGLPGIALLLFKQFGWNLALVQLVGGFAMLILAAAALGKKGLFRAVIGTLILPIFIEFFSFAPALTDNLILAAGFGGLAIGAGLGLIFYAGISVGGLSIIAQVLAKKFSIPPAKSIFLMDAAIVCLAGGLFGPESSMYALVAVFCIGKAIDLVQSGLNLVKAAMIITDQPELVRETLLETLDCGATIVPAEGAYSGDKRSLIICVVPRAKISRLKRHVHHADPKAFTLVTNASEVLGYGFQQF